MVMIRLARAGTTNHPFYHVIVADKRNARDGRNIERIGYFNPLPRGKDVALQIDLARVDHWVAVGAQTSDKVAALIKRFRSESASQAAAA